jgi:hypothetical protein
MIVNPEGIAQAIVYPFTNGVIILAVAVFSLLLWLASAAGILGLWLLIAVLPAVARFQMIVIEARARGRDPDPPGIEFFSLVGDGWQLFPVVHMLLIAAGAYYIGESFGTIGALVFCSLVTFVLPASLIALAVTRSPLECINPAVLIRLIDRLGTIYLVLPVFLLVATGLLLWVGGLLPATVHIALELFTGFAFASLAGAVAQPFDLFDQVDIHAPVEQSEENVAADLDAERTKVLNHAYGFVSRDNRSGGLAHIYGWLKNDDPVPLQGWAWFQEQMFRWERNEASLFYAQQYIKRLLIDEQDVAAVKLIMRCRLVNESFKPLAEDMPRAINAARACNNEELAAVLERA